MTAPVDWVDAPEPEQRKCRTCSEAALPYSDYCHACYWGRTE